MTTGFGTIVVSNLGVPDEPLSATDRSHAAQSRAVAPARIESASPRAVRSSNPLIGVLQRLNDADVLDDLSEELAMLDPDERAEFVAAIDTLQRLASRIELTARQADPLESELTASRLSSGRLSEHVDVTIDDMAAMLVELMAGHEASAGYDAISRPNWRSPGGRCEVSKSGQSAALLWSLQQHPEAVFAEYRIWLDGEEVWNWSDKVWPDLSTEASKTALVRIPTLCFDAIVHHLEQHSADWVQRWRTNAESSRRSSLSGA